jgi:hypothetical protein
LVALASNARRYPPDISKLRMTAARPTTGDAKVFIVTSDWNDRSLIANHQFRGLSRHDANAKLAGVIGLR